MLSISSAECQFSSHIQVSNHSVLVEAILRVHGSAIFAMANLSVVHVQRVFCKHFKIQPWYPIPVRGTILNWVRNFHATASASNWKSTGPRKTIRTPEDIERVRSSLQASPTCSLRKCAQTQNISPASTHRIIRNDLHYHPYKLAVTKVTPRRLSKTKNIRLEDARENQG